MITSSSTLSMYGSSRTWCDTCGRKANFAGLVCSSHRVRRHARKMVCIEVQQRTGFIFFLLAKGDILNESYTNLECFAKRMLLFIPQEDVEAMGMPKSSTSLTCLSGIASCRTNAVGRTCCCPRNAGIIEIPWSTRVWRRWTNNSGVQACVYIIKRKYFDRVLLGRCEESVGWY